MDADKIDIWVQRANKTYPTNYNPEEYKIWDKSGELTLEEITDHIKIHYLKETNCISFSTNANVSLDYGNNYRNQYAIMKIPKPLPEEVAERMGITVEKVQQIQKIAQEPISLESPVCTVSPFVSSGLVNSLSTCFFSFASMAISTSVVALPAASATVPMVRQAQSKTNTFPKFFFIVFIISPQL